jgi:hypothetical protein
MKILLLHGWHSVPGSVNKCRRVSGWRMAKTNAARNEKRFMTAASGSDNLPQP